MAEVMLPVALVGAAVALVVRLLARRRGRPAYQDGGKDYHFRVTEPLEVVRSVVQYVGQHGHGWLMIEGNFEHPDTSALPVTAEPPVMLKRHTTWSFPKEQVLVVPISSETLTPVSDSLLPSMLGEATHVQVADENRFVFGAYDNFEVAWVPEGALPIAMLQLFEARGVIARIEGIVDNW